VSGGAQPVSSRAESQSVDDVSGLERVEVLAFVEIPKSSSAVLATRSAKRSIRRNSDSVDVSSMAVQVGSKLAVRQVPDLNHSVPSSRDDYGILRRESDAADPLGVSLILNGVLALSKSIPQLDGSVSRSRNDLSVVSRESNAQDVLSMSNESSSGESRIKIPQSESSVPRARKTELSIRGDDNILDEVRMSVERSSRSSVVLVRFSSEVPNDDALVSRSRKEHIRILR